MTLIQWADRPRAGWVVLAAVLLVTGFFGHFAKIDRIDNRLEDNVMPGEALQAYYRFLETFGNDRILLAGFEVGTITPALVRAMFQTEKALLAHRNVQTVWSPISPLRSQLGVETEKDFEAFIKEERQIDRYLENLRKTRSLEKTAISTDWQVAGIIIRLKQETGDLVGESIQEIREILRTNLNRPFHLTGVPEITRLILDMTKRDQKRFSPLALLFISLILIFLYRSRFGLFIPLLSIVGAMIWTKGLMIATGFSTNFITGILPPMVISIALTYAVHVLTEYFVLCGDADEFRPEIVIQAVRQVAKPVFLSAFTTMVGFGSLIYGSVDAIAQFGLFAAIGTFFSCLLALLVVPAGIVAFRAVRKNQELTGSLEQYLERWTLWVIDHPKGMWGFLLVLAVVFSYGISILPVETSLIRYLPDDHDIQAANAFVESRLSGIVPIEILLESRGPRFTEPEVVHRVRRIQERLLDLPLVDRTISYVDLVQDFDRMFSSETWNIPRTEEEIRDYLSFYMPSSAFKDDEEEEAEAENASGTTVASVPVAFPAGGMLAEFIASDSMRAHVGLRLQDRSSKEFVAEFRTIRSIIREELAGADIDFHLTGRALMWAEVSEILVLSEATSFGMSLVVIALVIMLYFRSVYLGLIAMIPNVFPLLWTYGIMGLCGISFNTVTGMIASIAIGLAVDDTIHIFYQFTQELHQCRDSRQALIRTMTHKGRAVCFTSFVLAGGFSVLSFSGFGPTRYFGIFISLAVMSALICELIVTPLVLTTFQPVTLPPLDAAAPGGSEEIKP